MSMYRANAEMTLGDKESYRASRKILEMELIMGLSNVKKETSNLALKLRRLSEQQGGLLEEGFSMDEELKTENFLF